MIFSKLKVSSVVIVVVVHSVSTTTPCAASSFECGNNTQTRVCNILDTLCGFYTDSKDFDSAILRMWHKYDTRCNFPVQAGSFSCGYNSAVYALNKVSF